MKDYIASTQSTPQHLYKQHQNCNNEDSINKFISDFRIPEAKLYKHPE